MTLLDALTTTPQTYRVWRDIHARKVSDEVRFWARVERTEGCWIWHGAQSAGYGRFKPLGHPKHGGLPAHRYAYELLVGPIPDGLQIDHLCRNHSCVNPAHMEPVTIRENLLRGRTHAAANSRKTACPRGHEYTEANTRRYRGRRNCRACAAAR